MSVLTDYGLKENDVEFLLTIQDVEQNPTEYDNTGPGETVANVTVLKQNTDLSKSQIDYRARQGEDSRGLAEEGLNLIRSHAPTIENTGYGPRSVELTEKGERVVAEIKDLRSQGPPQQGGSSGASSERIEELEAEVAELREAVENNSERVETFGQNRMGAIGGDMSAKLEAISRAFPKHDFVLSEVLGVDMDAVAAADLDDEESIRKLRVAAYNHLTESIDEVDAAKVEPPAGDSEAGTSPRN